MVGVNTETNGANPNDRESRKEAAQVAAGGLAEVCNTLSPPPPPSGPPAETPTAPPTLPAKEREYLASLASSLCTASRAAGTPTLPEGKREEVVELLNRCVVNPMVRDTYLAELDAARQHAGISIASLANTPENTPETEILRDGFSGLPDHILADHAHCPIAVLVLWDLVNRMGPWSDESPEDVGPWLMEAVAREYGLIE